MRTFVIVFLLVSGVAPAPLSARPLDAREQSPTGNEVCLAIEEDRDTLSPQERTSALLVLAARFELAGRRVVRTGCAVQYSVSHVRFGDTIFVRLSGAGETREGTALGLDDLSALYSQMVRSVLSGRPMSGFNVVDRTNVTAVQVQANRVHSERYGYARLGYGAVLGDNVYGMPSFGFGYRVESDSVGLDVSFFNMLTGGAYESSGGAVAGSLIRLQGLYFMQPEANASPYVGGGLSWGGTSFQTGSKGYNADTYRSGYDGSGLHGEVTVGYELPRASTFRVFVEGTAVLPFYRVRSTTYTYSPPVGKSPAAVSETRMTVDSRYAPSVVLSLGMGWDRSRRR